MAQPKKELTNTLGKFVSNFQNFTFAIRNFPIFGKSEKLERKLDKGAHIIKCRTKKIYKFVFYKTRVKGFLNDQLDGFSREHSILFSLIEHGDVKKSDDNKLLYEKCKHNLSVIIRGTRRLNAKKITNNETTMSLISDRIRIRRLETTYTSLHLSA